MRAATFGFILLAAAAGGFYPTLAMLGVRESQGIYCARDSIVQGYRWQLLEEPARQKQSVTTAKPHPYGTLISSRFSRMPGSGGRDGRGTRQARQCAHLDLVREDCDCCDRCLRSRAGSGFCGSVFNQFDRQQWLAGVQDARWLEYVLLTVHRSQADEECRCGSFRRHLE